MYRVNLPWAWGSDSTGGLLNLFFASLKAASWLGPHLKGTPFLVRSLSGFRMSCRFGQYMLRDVAEPQNMCTFAVFLGVSWFLIASVLLFNGWTVILFSSILKRFPR